MTPQVPNNNPSRVALVTGATGAIGKAIARQIAAHPDFGVVLACRDEAKAERVVREIVTATGNSTVRYAPVDVSRRSSIEALAADWRGPLHVLVNNAAVAPRTRQETPDGIERQFATNVLGYFWMVQAFTEHLRRSAPARVVNVASYWAGDLDLGDLEFRRRPYNNNDAYRQSKQADRMLTVAFAERLKLFGVTVNACHPGDVNSTVAPWRPCPRVGAAPAGPTTAPLAYCRECAVVWGVMPPLIYWGPPPIAIPRPKRTLARKHIRRSLPTQTQQQPRISTRYGSRKIFP